MEVLLKRGELLDLGKNLTGRRVTCQSGCCWLTQAGDDRDHILRSGDCFDIGLHGRVLVTASEDCRLLLVAETCTAQADTLWQTLPCRS